MPAIPLVITQKKSHASPHPLDMIHDSGDGFSIRSSPGVLGQVDRVSGATALQWIWESDDFYIHMGEVVLQQNYGAAQDNSLTCIFSATKAITSAASWLLMQEKVISENDLVSDYIPGFGENGKAKTTLSHLLTHTAGFPHAPFRPIEWKSKEARLRRFEQWRSFWEPGTKFDYHPSSSMYVVAEIIERASGQNFESFVKDHILNPLQLRNTFIGLPDEQSSRALPIK